MSEENFMDWHNSKEEGFKIHCKYKVVSIDKAKEGYQNVSCVEIEHKEQDAVIDKKYDIHVNLLIPDKIENSTNIENFIIPDNIPVEKKSQLEIYTNDEKFNKGLVEKYVNSHSSSYALEAQGGGFPFSQTHLLIKNGKKGFKILLTEENGKYRDATSKERSGFNLRFDDVWDIAHKVEKYYDEDEERVDRIFQKAKKIEKLRAMTKGIKEGMDKSTPIKEVDAAAPFNVVAKKLEKGGR